jgi:hypothetical protein
VRLRLLRPNDKDWLLTGFDALSSSLQRLDTALDNVSALTDPRAPLADGLVAAAELIRVDSRHYGTAALRDPRLTLPGGTT